MAFALVIALILLGQCSLTSYGARKVIRENEGDSLVGESVISGTSGHSLVGFDRLCEFSLEAAFDLVNFEIYNPDLWYSNCVMIPPNYCSYFGLRGGCLKGYEAGHFLGQKGPIWYAHRAVMAKDFEQVDQFEISGRTESAPYRQQVSKLYRELFISNLTRFLVDGYVPRQWVGVTLYPAKHHEVDITSRGALVEVKGINEFYIGDTIYNDKNVWIKGYRLNSIVPASKSPLSHPNKQVLVKFGFMVYGNCNNITLDIPANAHHYMSVLCHNGTVTWLSGRPQQFLWSTFVCNLYTDAGLFAERVWEIAINKTHHIGKFLLSFKFVGKIIDYCKLTYFKLYNIKFDINWQYVVLSILTLYDISTRSLCGTYLLFFDMAYYVFPQMYSVFDRHWKLSPDNYASILMIGITTYSLLLCFGFHFFDVMRFMAKKFERKIQKAWSDGVVGWVSWISMYTFYRLSYLFLRGIVNYGDWLAVMLGNALCNGFVCLVFSIISYWLFGVLRVRRAMGCSTTKEFVVIFLSLLSGFFMMCALEGLTWMHAIYLDTALLTFAGFNLARLLTASIPMLTIYWIMHKIYSFANSYIYSADDVGNRTNVIICIYLLTLLKSVVHLMFYAFLLPMVVCPMLVVILLGCSFGVVALFFCVFGLVFVSVMRYGGGEVYEIVRITRDLPIKFWRVTVSGQEKNEQKRQDLRRAFLEVLVASHSKEPDRTLKALESEMDVELRSDKQRLELVNYIMTNGARMGDLYLKVFLDLGRQRHEKYMRLLEERIKAGDKGFKLFLTAFGLRAAQPGRYTIDAEEEPNMYTGLGTHATLWSMLRGGANLDQLMLNLRNSIGEQQIGFVAQFHTEIVAEWNRLWNLLTPEERADSRRNVFDEALENVRARHPDFNPVADGQFEYDIQFANDAAEILYYTELSRTVIETLAMTYEDSDDQEIRRTIANIVEQMNLGMDSLYLPKHKFSIDIAALSKISPEFEAELKRFENDFALDSDAKVSPIIKATDEAEACRIFAKQLQDAGHSAIFSGHCYRSSDAIIPKGAFVVTEIMGDPKTTKSRVGEHQFMLYIRDLFFQVIGWRDGRWNVMGVLLSGYDDVAFTDACKLLNTISEVPGVSDDTYRDMIFGQRARGAGMIRFQNVVLAGSDVEVLSPKEIYDHLVTTNSDRTIGRYMVPLIDYHNMLCKPLSKLPRGLILINRSGVPCVIGKKIYNKHNLSKYFEEFVFMGNKTVCNQGFQSTAWFFIGHVLKNCKHNGICIDSKFTYVSPSGRAVASYGLEKFTGKDSGVPAVPPVSTSFPFGSLGGIVAKSSVIGNMVFVSSGGKHYAVTASHVVALRADGKDCNLVDTFLTEMDGDKTVKQQNAIRDRFDTEPINIDKKFLVPEKLIVNTAMSNVELRFYKFDNQLIWYTIVKGKYTPLEISPMGEPNKFCYLEGTGEFLTPVTSTVNSEGHYCSTYGASGGALMSGRSLVGIHLGGDRTGSGRKYARLVTSSDCPYHTVTDVEVMAQKAEEIGDDDVDFPMDKRNKRIFMYAAPGGMINWSYFDGDAKENGMFKIQDLSKKIAELALKHPGSYVSLMHAGDGFDLGCLDFTEIPIDDAVEAEIYSKIKRVEGVVPNSQLSTDVLNQYTVGVSVGVAKEISQLVGENEADAMFALDIAELKERLDQARRNQIVITRSKHQVQAIKNFIEAEMASSGEKAEFERKMKEYATRRADLQVQQDEYKKTYEEFKKEYNKRAEEKKKRLNAIREASSAGVKRFDASLKSLKEQAVALQRIIDSQRKEMKQFNTGMTVDVKEKLKFIDAELAKYKDMRKKLFIEAKLQEKDNPLRKELENLIGSNVQKLTQLKSERAEKVKAKENYILERKKEINALKLDPNYQPPQKPEGPKQLDPKPRQPRAQELREYDSMLADIRKLANYTNKYINAYRKLLKCYETEKKRAEVADVMGSKDDPIAQVGLDEASSLLEGLRSDILCGYSLQDREIMAGQIIAEFFNSVFMDTGHCMVCLSTSDALCEECEVAYDMLQVYVKSIREMLQVVRCEFTQEFINDFIAHFNSERSNQIIDQKSLSLSTVILNLQPNDFNRDLFLKNSIIESCPATMMCNTCGESFVCDQAHLSDDAETVMHIACTRYCLRLVAEQLKDHRTTCNSSTPLNMVTMRGERKALICMHGDGNMAVAACPSHGGSSCIVDFRPNSSMIGVRVSNKVMYMNPLCYLSVLFRMSLTHEFKQCNRSLTTAELNQFNSLLVDRPGEGVLEVGGLYFNVGRWKNGSKMQYFHELFGVRVPVEKASNQSSLPAGVDKNVVKVQLDFSGITKFVNDTNVKVKYMIKKFAEKNKLTDDEVQQFFEDNQLGGSEKEADSYIEELNTSAGSAGALVQTLDFSPESEYIRDLEDLADDEGVSTDETVKEAVEEIADDVLYNIMAQATAADILDPKISSLKDVFVEALKIALNTECILERIAELAQKKNNKNRRRNKDKTKVEAQKDKASTEKPASSIIANNSAVLNNAVASTSVQADFLEERAM